MIEAFDAAAREALEHWLAAAARAVRALLAHVERLERGHVESERQLREWQDRTAQAEARAARRGALLVEAEAYVWAALMNNIDTKAAELSRRIRAELTPEAARHE